MAELLAVTIAALAIVGYLVFRRSRRQPDPPPVAGIKPLEEAVVAHPAPVAASRKPMQTAPSGKAPASSPVERLAQIQRSLDDWSAKIDDLKRENSPKLGATIIAFEAVLQAADEEMRDIKRHAGTSSNPAVEGPPPPELGFVLKTSHAGNPYYQNPTPLRLDGVPALKGNALPDYAIAGCLHYQEALNRAAFGRRDHAVYFRTNALLRREPENPHDPDAVVVTINGEMVGHVPRDDAAQFGAELTALGGDGVFQCLAVVSNGKPDWYVQLDVLRPLRLR